MSRELLCQRVSPSKADALVALGWRITATSTYADGEQLSVLVVRDVTDAEIEARRRARKLKGAGLGAWTLAGMQGHVERIESDESRDGVQPPDFTSQGLNRRARQRGISAGQIAIALLCLLLAVLTTIAVVHQQPAPVLPNQGDRR